MSRYARLQMNIHPAMLDALNRQVAAINAQRSKREGFETITNITLPMLCDWLRNQGVEVDLEWLMKPSEWTKEE